jgi:hypothetical protein
VVGTIRTNDLRRTNARNKTNLWAAQLSLWELTQGSALVLRNKRYSLRYQILALQAFNSYREGLIFRDVFYEGKR